MVKYSAKVNLRNAKILDIGVGGDPVNPEGKPGGNWQFFGEHNNYKTLDCVAEFNPDYVADISKGTDFEDNEWDLVLCSQVIEHIWDYKAAQKEIYRITRQYAIIDCPWNWPHHPEPEFADYWRFSPQALERLLKEAGFKEVKISNNNFVISALVKK